MKKLLNFSLIIQICITIIQILLVDEVEKFLENTEKTLEKFPNNLSAKMLRMIAKLWNQQFDQESENLYKQINSSLKSYLPMQYKRKMGMRLLRYCIDESDYERQNNTMRIHLYV